LILHGLGPDSIVVSNCGEYKVTIDLSQMLLVLAISLGTGALASLMGLGGGIILVPVFTLLLGIPFPVAAATSIVAVVAASNGAALKFHKSGLTNVSLGLWLEIGTVVGAVLGVLAVGVISPSFLYCFFGATLILATLTMLKGRQDLSREDNSKTPSYPLSAALGLNTEDYKVRRPVLGLFLSVFAGALSSMLGVGGGIVKLPLMNAVMQVPLRCAVATSSFMIGITATTGAFMYYLQGKLDLALVAPTVVGVLAGAYFSSQFLTKIPVSLIKRAFALIAFVAAIRMIVRGVEML